MAIMQNDSNDKQIDETERANINNANNIRNAANVAIASKNPYAMTAGAAVKGLDKATGGKSTDAFGKLATRTTQRMPGGNRVQSASNKLAESGLSDKVGKGASHVKGVNDKVGNGPTAKKTDSDVGAQNLKKSKSNRSNNLWNSFKNRKDNKKEDETEKSSDDNSTSSSTDTLNVGKVGFKIKIVIFASILLVGIMLVGTIIMALFGVNISSTLPAINQSTYGTDNFESTYEKGTKEYEQEINYYKKLKAAGEEYAKENSEEIKTNYVHAVLIYMYYIVDDIDEEMTNNQTDMFSVDYKKMTDMIDTIIELMKPSSTSKNIDYEKNGEFYNNLKNSVEFKKYYKKILENKDLNELLDEIFDFAKEIDDIEYYEDTVITEETNVTLNEKDGNSNKNTTMSMNDYIAGSIYANNSISNAEKVKAYTIAYSTNIVAKNKKLTISSNNASADNLVCDAKLGCSYDKNGYLVAGSGERSSQNTLYYNGGYYYKQPLSSSEITELNKSINLVYGNVLVNSDGTYPELDVNTINGLGDNTYQELLKTAYGDYKIKNVGEDSYILDGSYGTEKVLTSIIFYDQSDYKSYQFCGKKKENIKTSGCGTTAMAMVVSTYENNKKYDPVMMMKAAYSAGYCGKGISGTSPGFFKKEAKTMKYKYLRASKSKKSDLNLVLKHLSEGHFVITHMKSGHFTGGGHYMVLGGVDPSTKKVYVYDPNNASNSKNRKTGNGWYSFNNIIVKESFNYFYIVWKG